MQNDSPAANSEKTGDQQYGARAVESRVDRWEVANRNQDGPARQPVDSVTQESPQIP